MSSHEAHITLTAHGLSHNDANTLLADAYHNSRSRAGRIFVHYLIVDDEATYSITYKRS